MAANNVDLPVSQFMRVMKAGKLPHGITVLGDSTGNDDNEWVNLFVTWLKGKFPEYTVEQRLWSDARQAHDPPVLRQTGAAGLRRYVSSGASTDRTFVVADSVANSIVGDMTVDFQVKFTALPASAFSVCSKRDGGAGHVSWRFELNTSGTLTLYWSADGTNEIIKSSTVSITSAMYQNVYWYRVKLDVDNGATQNEVKFYTSPDATTWTQLGATVTTAAVTSVFDSDSNVIFNGRGGAQTVLPGMEFWNMRLYSGITDSTMAPVVDINTAQYYPTATGVAGSFKGMAVGETVTGFTSSTGTFTGAPVLTIYNGSHPGAAFSYLNASSARRAAMAPYVSDLVFVSDGLNEGTDVVNYPTTYGSYITSIRALMPRAGFVCVAQSPRLSSHAEYEAHNLRMAMVPNIAMVNSAMCANVFEAINNTGEPDLYISSDGTHPTSTASKDSDGTLAAGFQLWADTVIALFDPYKPGS